MISQVIALAAPRCLADLSPRKQFTQMFVRATPNQKKLRAEMAIHFAEPKDIGLWHLGICTAGS
jgi:hypothetical protein